jgi:hypothetical protein
MGKKSTNIGEFELLRFCNKLNTNVVGGVLPQEVFDARFERDPDDVMRMQSGYRTQQKIEPQNIEYEFGTAVYMVKIIRRNTETNSISSNNNKYKN